MQNNSLALMMGIRKSMLGKSHYNREMNLKLSGVVQKRRKGSRTNVKRVKSLKKR
jgi:hypothetical protein